jgi:hypothetical protein
LHVVGFNKPPALRFVIKVNSELHVTSETLDQRRMKFVLAEPRKKIKGWVS